MKLFIVLGFAALFNSGNSYQPAETKEDVLVKVWNAVGGKSAFEKSRYFRFDFTVESEGKVTTVRRHLWDRYTGDYRLERKTQDGQNMIVLFNTNSQTGQSYIDGMVETVDTNNTKNVSRAYTAFINDTYWLINPAKLEDPGVNVTLLPDEKADSLLCHVLGLTFGNDIGLTPQDQYWLYVNKETGEIVRWKYKLQNSATVGEWKWEPYRNIGGLNLSVRKTAPDGKRVISFPVAKVSESVNTELFNNAILSMD